MKIQSIELGRIRIPLARPFKTALRSVSEINDVAVRITADTGEVGYGEAPPTAVITGDTIGSITEAIEGYIAPSITGMDLENLDGIMARLHSCILKNTSAKAAVDMAVYDLWGKRFGAPLHKLLGGYRTELETDITISVNPIDEMVADSLDAVRQGFRILKVKVGKEGRADVERIAKIREAVASGYNTPEDLFAALANDPDEGVRGCVAKNEATPCDILRSLADDRSETVRGWVAVNYSVPADVMAKLAKDRSRTVRSLVKWKAQLADEEGAAQRSPAEPALRP